MSEATLVTLHTVVKILPPNDDQLHGQNRPIPTIQLPFQLRQKSRFKYAASDQLEFRFFLERGTVLQCGDIVQSDTGNLFRIVAAPEAVVSVRLADNDLLFARCCYHLGNRHVPLEIISEQYNGQTTHCLRFQEDKVLADMLTKLGASPLFELAPFQPEKGAYSH